MSYSRRSALEIDVDVYYMTLGDRLNVRTGRITLLIVVLVDNSNDLALGEILYVRLSRYIECAGYNRSLTVNNEICLIVY